MKARKAIPLKLRASLQQDINSECPLCSNRDVGHFEVHHVDENPDNNDPSNLLLLCRICHSKVTKGDISNAHIVGIKQTLLRYRTYSAIPEQSQTNNFSGTLNQPVIGSGNSVTITVKNTRKSKYPEGCIGSDIAQANYISYLITRYHEYKEWEVGKEGMRYGLFPSQLKKRYRIGKQRTLYHLPSSAFASLAEYIQDRISGTKLAKINAAKGSKRHFTPFEEYVASAEYQAQQSVPPDVPATASRR